GRNLNIWVTLKIKIRSNYVACHHSRLSIYLHYIVFWVANKGLLLVTEQETHTILVVDDDPALQKLVVSLIRRAGMETLSAIDAHEAAKQLEGDILPDLILL